MDARPSGDHRTRRSPRSVPDATGPREGKDRRLLKLVIPPDLARVRDARLLMDRAALLVGLDERKLFDLQVVVSEACANAIQHGGGEVEVAAWLLADRIVVEVSNAGGFQTGFLSDKAHRGAGLGLPLMASLADQIQLTRLTSDLTRLSLTFLLAPSQTDRDGGLDPPDSKEAPRSRQLADPRVHALVLTPREVRERKQQERRLVKRAYQDALTGLVNRDLFFGRAEEALSRSGRDDGSVGVILLDVDEFKTVNDSLGHAAGDQLLATVGARLRSLLREGDTAARLGGDEFALLVKAGDASDLVGVADRIMTRLREPYVLSIARLSATFSMGVTASSSAATTIRELLHQADLALYVAKSQGKDSWRLFEQSMLAAERLKREKEEELRRAVASREIVAFFQPILSTANHRIIGLEVLARWNHPAGDLLLPESFLGLAEETGLIVPLGQAVLEQACRCVSQWDARCPGSRLQLMVNMSLRELRERDLAERIGGALARSGLGPDRLVLEVSEGALAGNSVGVAESLTALRTIGARVAVDDFGCGPSSLIGLKAYPIDILKMAQPVVGAVSETEEGELVAAAVMNLARSVGAQVVAEGVEKPGQLEKLEALGCDMWQGKHFSMALPPMQIPRLLKRCRVA